MPDLIPVLIPVLMPVIKPHTPGYVLKPGGGYYPTEGCKAHPHLKVRQWLPYYWAARRFIIAKLKAHDKDTVLMRAEAEQFFNSLYVRPQTIRTGTPLEKADAILANVHAQRKRSRYWPNGCKSFPVSLHLVVRMMAVKLCLQHSGLRPKGTEERPRYDWVQQARAIHRLLKADRQTFTRDDGHGNVRTMTLFYKCPLRSWNTCKRMSERLETIFKWYVHDHGCAIASQVFNPPKRKPYVHTKAKDAARAKGSETVKRNRQERRGLALPHHL